MTEEQTIQIFDPVYWLSKPPEVRKLEINTTPDNDVRKARAIELALRGFQIDVPIMVWGWDPWKVMHLRQEFGYTWVPNALQAPVGAAPGLTGPGITPYDPNNPPGGAIRVSTSIADYPPFDPPVAAPSMPQAFVPVGTQSLGNLYYSTKGDTHLDGEKYSDTRGTFIKHIYVTPFGLQPIWILQ